MRLRILHRRLGLTAAAFLLFAAGTGVWLEASRLIRAIEDSRAEPGRAIAEIQLRPGRRRFSAVIQSSGGPEREIVIDGFSGAVERDGPRGGDNWLVHLHSGQTLGPFGYALALLWGGALLGMSVTGLWI